MNTKKNILLRNNYINQYYFSNINIQKKTINILNDDIWVIS